MDIFTLHRASHVAWQEGTEGARIAEQESKMKGREESWQEVRNSGILVYQILFYSHHSAHTDTVTRKLSLITSPPHPLV